ncbi:MAG: hypothetical protein DMG65_19925 [Candidatus Angelobacter sp. Gp1-AA117]|nr:MAG: hypothetical protein DMG65_19925 [Candidatus Angelobacter sp. Gp1-AA117]
MSTIRLFLLASLLILAASVMAQEQTTSSAPAETKPAETQPTPDAKTATDAKPAADVKPATGKLPFKAALVLTPEFCETKIQPKGSVMTKEWGSFDVGKVACKELEPALKDVFSSLTRVAAPPAAEEAQLVLIPKITDVNATTATMAFSNRELVVMIEWTVKDSAGKTVWLETVQGSAKHHMGNLFTHKKNQELIVTDSVKAAATESASKMSASPELHKLAPGN